MPPRPHMRDICKIGVYDDQTYGPEPEESFNYGTQTRCRFLRTTTREVIDGKRRAFIGVVIHLPSPSAVSEKSRIQLIRRNGATLETPEYFRVTGEPWNTEDNRVVVCECEQIPIGAE